MGSSFGLLSVMKAEAFPATRTSDTNECRKAFWERIEN
jgi:hypothetical protein